MSESVKVTNFPQQGSRERVAFDLYANLVGLLPRKEGLDRIKQCLELFTVCRDRVFDRDAEIDTTKFS